MRRRSLRQQQLTPDGTHLALPSDEQVALAERRTTIIISHEDEPSRPPPGTHKQCTHTQRKTGLMYT